MDVTRNTDSYEKQYIEILKSIYKYGDESVNERTGVATLRIPHAVMTVDLEEEFPILKSRFVPWKVALNEILWIMRLQSSNVNDLNSKIWDAWADETGSIGKAYGYQVGQPVAIGGMHYPSQVHYVLSKLANDPTDRRCMINLWNVADLNEMNLVPCCFNSIWTIVDGRLNCLLTQRSADFLVGVPFNTTQYAILLHLFARHLGVGVGRITHVMADAHIYKVPSHMDNGKTIIDNFHKYYDLPMVSDGLIEEFSAAKNDRVTQIFKVAEAHPFLEINTDEVDFFSIPEESINIGEYEWLDKFKFEVIP